MSTTQRANKDVLVADGIDFYRRMLIELLRGQGYRLHEAENAEQALSRLEGATVDLLVLDLGLPPLGAREFLAEARSRVRKELRVVGLVQGYQEESDVEQLREMGVAAVVSRSAPVDDILVAARTALFPEAKNLRKSPRAQVHIPVSYRIESDAGEVGAEIGTHSFNLSADGMFLVTSTLQPAAPGTKLHIRFWLPAANDVIEAEGVVVWCNQAGGRVNELYPPGMGVMFLGLRRDAAFIVTEYVRERVMNALR